MGKRKLRMFLKSISLTNFRNYTKQDFKFKSQITLLIGDNAQGKTNFLESIYFLATTKSTKADREQELIKYGEDFLRVEGGIDSDINLEIAMQFQESYLAKKIKVNGVPRKTSDYSQNLTAVLFTPDNINLITGSPSLRRFHMDQTLCQVDKDYKKTLSAYENIIIRKNRLLKLIQERKAKKDQLTYWIDEQILLGILLSEKRKKYFDFLNNAEKKFGEFYFNYLPNEITVERLDEYLEKEILSASSLIGPHRDDFLILLNEKDLSKYGSRGEQRTAVMDLKITEAAYIEYILGERPILLLDDIFSELDLSHRQHVLELAKLQQTIITAIELDINIKKEFKDFRSVTFYVQDGKILEKADKSPKL